MKRTLLYVPVLLALTFGVSGCINQMLTEAIVEAPNERGLPYVLRPEGEQLLTLDRQTFSAEWMLPVGPPPAKLSIAVVEPGNYGLVHTIEPGLLKDGRARPYPKNVWTLPKPGMVPPKPRGTIMILHGYQDTKEDMMHWALYLAQSGFRIVLVDLRGHGESTGDWIGYGAFEVHDLEQVIDDLHKRGLISGPLGVFGLSYGASVGLQLAGDDKRVKAVIAMEPFSDPRKAVVGFARAVVPGLVKNWSDTDFANAEDRAGRLAGLSWKDADVLESVARATAPILYVYSENDHWVSPENTRLLAANTRSPHSVLTVHFDGTGGLEEHVLLSWILDPIAPSIARWLDVALVDQTPGVGARLKSHGCAP